MIIHEENLAWLLEESNPSIRYRTMTELLGIDADDVEAQSARARIADSAPVALLFSAMEEDGSWRYTYRDQINRYLKYLSASLSFAAELGLASTDDRVVRAVQHLFSLQKADGDFHRHYSCYNGLFLRALNRLGFGASEHAGLLRTLVLESIRHDGGTHCDLRPRRGRAAPTPYLSCIKGSIKTLLAFAEDAELTCTEACGILVDYFLKRRLIFRTDAPDVPVVGEITRLSFPITYHPALIEPLYALSRLGYGPRKELDDPWEILLGKADENGRLRLEKSVPWHHLRTGTRGRPNKWLTLYAGIVEKNRCKNPTLAK